MRRTIIAAFAVLAALTAIPALAGSSIYNPFNLLALPSALIPGSDNALNVGAVSFRWNRGFFGGEVDGGSFLSAGSNVAGASSNLGWNGRTSMFAPADGVTIATKNAGGQLTVSTLPSAATAGAGARAVVSDATACTFAAAPTGGGSTVCPVYSTGAAWLEG